jgi:hypothetical protein
MLLISRHLRDFNHQYPIYFPNNTVIRINMAWEDNYEKLIYHIQNIKNNILLDIPSNRKKPPNTQWQLHEIIPLFFVYKNLKYLAISNVEYAEDIMYPLVKLPHHIAVVPKIETIAGIENIKEIINHLREKRIIILDHDDLFTDLLKNNINGSLLYTDYINPLIEKCKKLGVEVLRTAGVIFAS